MLNIFAILCFIFTILYALYIYIYYSLCFIYLLFYALYIYYSMLYISAILCFFKYVFFKNKCITESYSLYNDLFAQLSLSYLELIVVFFRSREAHIVDLIGMINKLKINFLDRYIRTLSVIRNCLNMQILYLFY